MDMTDSGQAKVRQHKRFERDEVKKGVSKSRQDKIWQRIGQTRRYNVGQRTKGGRRRRSGKVGQNKDERKYGTEQRGL